MHQVYQFAHVTISASAASNSDGGLFFDSQQPISHFVSGLALRGSDTTDYRIVDRQLWKGSVDDGPLRKRAWTLQERMLSGRLLHFGREEIFWQCARTLECQSYPEDLAWVTTDSFLKGRCALDATVSRVDASRQCAVHVRLALRWNGLENFREMWQNIVRVYNRCDLTFECDKLVAIGGLARWLHAWHGVPYYAGLWEEGMLFQLLWTVRGCRQANGEPSKRPRQYIAPSWSWASVIGNIETEHSNTPYNSYSVSHLAKVVNVKVEKAGMTSFGQITGGYLRLRGTTYDVQVRKNEDSSYEIKYNDKVAQGYLVTLWVYLDVDLCIGEYEFVFFPLWHGLQLDRVYGLLLQDVYGDGSKYSRVEAMAISRASCRDLHFNLQPLRTSGPVSRTYSGADITDEGFQSIVIV